MFLCNQIVTVRKEVYPVTACLRTLVCVRVIIVESALIECGISQQCVGKDSQVRV